jgi:hypothetical protein
MSAVAESIRQLLPGATVPGVVYGPENGGWCGFFLPFPLKAVCGSDVLREDDETVRNADRAALRILAAAVGAMRPMAIDLTPHECEVIDILKAALRSLQSEKGILT